MKKFELNVVSYNNEDVIATSCHKEALYLTFTYTDAVIPHGADFVNGDKIWLKNGVKFENIFTYDPINVPLYIEQIPNGDYEGVYHLVDGKYVYCEDGCND